MLCSRVTYAYLECHCSLYRRVDYVPQLVHRVLLLYILSSPLHYNASYW